MTREILREKASTLAVAYNNLAVQREYLGHEDCLALYEKAWPCGQNPIAFSALWALKSGELPSRKSTLL